MPNPRPATWFLLGAASTAVLGVGFCYVAPRWLPPGGVVIHIGPNPPRPVSSDTIARPPVTPGVAPTALPAPTVAADSPMAGPATVPPPPTAQAPLPVAPPSEASGRLLVPVQGVRPDQLVDTYTAARSQGRRHDAIDIAARRGTPVLATAPGSVLKLFQSERGGTTLYELAPDQRTIYYYAHLDRYAPGMAEGRTLRQGDVIGYVGDTGNAGAGNYHLHFEISTTTDPRRYWAGTPQNPYPLLRAGVSRP